MEIFPCLKYSPRKIEIARESGNEIIIDRKEVKRVPTRKGRDPNLPNTGSHSLLYKKLIPNSLIEGIEFINNVAKIPTIKRTTRIPENNNIFRNTASDFNYLTSTIQDFC